MQRLSALLPGGIATLLLAACGGGGGGGNDTGGGSMPTPLVLAISVNGSSATPDATGTYRIKPGDTVQAVPSQAATWSTGSTDNGAAAARNPTVSTTQWSGPIINYRPAVETFTLSAQATANGTAPGPIASASFQVSAGDARNAAYQMFSANSTRQTLALSFDTLSYQLTEPAGTVVAGTFSADATDPGTWVAQRPSAGSSPAGRFRTTGGAVAGTFPVPSPSGGTSYVLFPFVAATTFVGTPAAVDDFYNQMGLEYDPQGMTMASVWIRNSGTQLLRCTSTSVRADQCPADSLASYTLAQDKTVPGRWVFTNTANAGDVGDVFVASIGGKNVLLSTLAAGHRNFRIGLAATTDWPAISAHAASTDFYSWGLLSLDTARYAVNSIPAGSVPLVQGLLDDPNNTSTANPPLIPGMRRIGPNFFFYAMQNSPLVVVATSGNSSHPPSLQIGTTD